MAWGWGLTSHTGHRPRVRARQDHARQGAGASNQDPEQGLHPQREGQGKTHTAAPWVTLRMAQEPCRMVGTKAGPWLGVPLNPAEANSESTTEGTPQPGHWGVPRKHKPTGEPTMRYHTLRKPGHRQNQEDTKNRSPNAWSRQSYDLKKTEHPRNMRNSQEGSIKITPNDRRDSDKEQGDAKASNTK